MENKIQFSFHTNFFQIYLDTFHIYIKHKEEYFENVHVLKMLMNLNNFDFI